RLADDQRIEPGGDPKEMPRDVEIFHAVYVRLHFRRLDAMEAADECDEIVPRARGVLAGGVELGAIARRHDDRFPRRAERADFTERRGNAARLEVELFAQFDRRGAMADSDEQDVHQKLWLVVRK